MKDGHDSSPTTQPKGSHPLEVKNVHDSSPPPNLKGHIAWKSRMSMIVSPTQPKPLEVKDVHDSSPTTQIQGRIPWKWNMSMIAPPQPKGSHPLEVKDVHDSSPHPTYSVAPLGSQECPWSSPPPNLNPWKWRMFMISPPTTQIQGRIPWKWNMSMMAPCRHDSSLPPNL